MRLERCDEETVIVVLSRRNLLALLAKLRGFPAKSSCTLSYSTKNNQRLLVQAEEDDVHYANPERDDDARLKPGKMHPETERQMKNLEKESIK